MEKRTTNYGGDCRVGWCCFSVVNDTIVAPSAGRINLNRYAAHLCLSV